MSVKKNVFDIMTVRFCQELNGKSLQVISADFVESAEKDTEGNDTGNTEKSLKLEVNIPIGNGMLSNLHFGVKIPKGELKFDDSILDDELVLIRFDDLSISFVDSRKTVYFKASDYEVIEEQFDI